MILKLETNSVDQTREIAEQLATKLHGGDVLTLSGDLGAGKTSFTQGLAKGLGVKRQVNSPTFTLIKEYKGTVLPLYHMDVYRLEDDLEDLGFDEYFYGEGVCVIEWPQMIASQLPPERLEITIRKTGEDSRELGFEAIGQRYESLLKEVFE